MKNLGGELIVQNGAVPPELRKKILEEFDRMERTGESVEDLEDKYGVVVVRQVLGEQNDAVEDPGPSDAEVQKEAGRLYHRDWDSLSSKQQDQVYINLGYPGGVGSKKVFPKHNAEGEKENASSASVENAYRLLMQARRAVEALSDDPATDRVRDIPHVKKALDAVTTALSEITYLR